MSECKASPDAVGPKFNYDIRFSWEPEGNDIDPPEVDSIGGRGTVVSIVKELRRIADSFERVHTPDPAHARPPAAEAVGWFEFITPVKSLTRIAYVYESGEVYLPEGGDPDDFVLAASYGQVYRLVREDAAQPPPPASEAERVLEGLVEEMRALIGKYESHLDTQESDTLSKVTAGVYHGLALVEAAQQRLAEQDRGREL